MPRHTVVGVKSPASASTSPSLAASYAARNFSMSTEVTLPSMAAPHTKPADGCRRSRSIALSSRGGSRSRRNACRRPRFLRRQRADCGHADETARSRGRAEAAGAAEGAGAQRPGDGLHDGQAGAGRSHDLRGSHAPTARRPSQGGMAGLGRPGTHRPLPPREQAAAARRGRRQVCAAAAAGLLPARQRKAAGLLRLFGGLPRRAGRHLQARSSEQRLGAQPRRPRHRLRPERGRPRHRRRAERPRLLQRLQADREDRRRPQARQGAGRADRAGHRRRDREADEEGEEGHLPLRRRPRLSQERQVLHGQGREAAALATRLEVTAADPRRQGQLGRHRRPVGDQAHPEEVPGDDVQARDRLVLLYVHAVDASVGSFSPGNRIAKVS